jgi:serine/threonine protein kinase
MLNQQFGNYKFLSILGEGGMAIVYLAENTMLGSLVAIKVLKEDFVSNKNVRSRFLDEAKKMVKVKHPNIIQVYDLIDAGDIVAIVMEYIEGQSLKDLIENQGKMSQTEIERLFPQILLALQHVHKAGFVHRDIKPSNFMLSTDGAIKLADFGIAKDKNVAAFTETGTQMGTPMYMSPEQIKSTRDVDHRSDIYSLGVVLYEMATGTFPFDKNNLSLPEIQVCILRDPLPTTGTLWDAQIAKATAKNETDRFQSCTNWMEIFAKKEQPNAFNKPVDKTSQPNTSSTNYSSSSSESTYDTSQKKYVFVGIGVILFIGILTFLLWPEKEVQVVGDATSSETVTVITSAEIENKDEAAMDIFLAELNNGKEYVCKDCKSEYKKGKASYLLTREHESITKVVKMIGDDVTEVKCAHGVKGKCTQCNPPTVLKCAHGKKSCNECKKKETSDKCAHGKIKKDCSTCTKKQPTERNRKVIFGTTDWVYEEEFAITKAYEWSMDNKMQQMADAICGKGKISVDDWNPGIYSTFNLRPGTYTCGCPK